ncbi:MAG: DUF3987 domain-containing protein [Leptolyngbyaceae cyanobacterium]
MNAGHLLEQLAALPEDLALVAVGAHKAPYLPNWQRSPLSKAQIESEIRAGRCKAVGVLCGTPSDGLVFLDHDGDSCDRLIETLSGLSLDEALPQTVGITSGRPGRYQLIYRLSQQDWQQVATRKLKTGTTGDDGKAEMLEFRWDGCQSVVLGHHPTTGIYRYLPGQSFAECDIAIAPQWIIQQMQSEPQSTSPSWAEFERQFRLPIDQAFPLEICLSKNSRELLVGVTQGNRDNAGAKLTRDLLGTVRYLESIGQPYEGNPRHHLDEFCARCTPPLSQKDSDRLWKSALKDNPGSSLSPDQIESCIKGWLWRQMRAEPLPVPLPVQPSSLIGSTADPPSLTLDDLQLQIRQFVSGAPTDTQLTAQVMTWASRIGKPESTLWFLVKSIQQELEHQQSRSETRTEIDRLTRLASYQPTLNRYLDPLLAHPLEQIAYWMGTTSMAMLTTLLPTAGSLLPVGTELELNTGTEHMVYPILYTGIVAESGSGKSPSQKIILKPLFRLQAEAEEVYRAALETWEDECRQSKEAGHATPQKPKPRDYFTTDATREAVVQIQANQPNSGFLGWFDELSALIRGQNQYRSGRGTDKESLLSGRDGSAQKVDRAGGKRLFIARSAYSITGSTQPDTLRSLMGDFSDPSGQWARFLWCFLPIRPAPYPENAVHLDVADFLYGIYRRLAEFPPTTYRLSLAARNCYINWYNELDRLRLAEVKQSLRAVHAKFKSDTGVLALLLHCLNAAIPGQTPAEQISEITLRTAIQLSKFYLGQVKLIHSEGDALDGDLTPSYCKMLSLSQRKGWVTARDIYRARAVCDRKATLDQIRVLMRELVTMGLAIARNEGNRLEIQAINRGDSHPSIGDNPQKSGDNPSEFGDSLLNAGDNWTAETNERELTSVSHSQNGTVTSDNPSVTTNQSSVTKNGAVVTTLSPGWQSRKVLPQEGSVLNNAEFVTTAQPQPPKARSPNFVAAKIQVGDVCRYRGPDGAMKVTCWGKDLQVLAIEAGTAKVKAKQWVHSHQIEIRYLRKIQ